MVKNSHNNKVNNYINIVNDLKGLGLLQRRRKRRQYTDPTQPKIQAKPQISGIERTIIDSSPQLRRDVQQLANERSILGERLMENENRLNFIHQQINETPSRFMTQPPRQFKLSDVQGDSLYLPSMDSLYKREMDTQTDSIDVPIVNASDSFKRSDQADPYQTKPEDVPIPNTPVTDNNVEESSMNEKRSELLKPKALFSDSLTGSLFTPERIRATSPRPIFKQIAEMTPHSQSKEIKLWTDKTYDRLKETMPRLTLERTESAVKRQVSNELNKASEQKIQQDQQEELKPDDKPRLKEPTSEQRKKKQAIERREIQKQLDASKADENPTLTALAKERELQDSTTELILEEYFTKLGGRKYVEENLDKDMQELLDFAGTGKVLKRLDDRALYDKFYGYLRLAGENEKAS